MKRCMAFLVIMLFPIIVWGQVIILAEAGIINRNKADSLVGTADTILATVDIRDISFADSIYLIYRLDTTKTNVYNTTGNAWADTAHIPKVSCEFKYLLDPVYDLSAVGTKAEADTLAFATVSVAWYRVADSLVSMGKYVWDRFHVDPVATKGQIRFFLNDARLTGAKRGVAIRWRLLAIKRNSIW